MDSRTAATFLAIPSAFLLGGYNIAFSQGILPALYGQPASIAAPIFKRAYFSGLFLFLPTFATSIASFSYLAYVSHTGRDMRQRNLYAASATMMLGMGLFLKLVMLPGVERLLDISETVGTTSQGKEPRVELSEDTTKLFMRCARLNLVRASLGMAAGTAGLYAVMLSAKEATR